MAESISIKPGSRVAILADIHGNSIALDGVLADIENSGGVDAYWFLGDYAAIGFDPIGVLATIRSLPNAHFIRGNTDRYLAESGHPWHNDLTIIEDPQRLALYVRVGRSFAWTTGAVAASGQLDWVRPLPLEFRATLPDGTCVLAVHSRPGEDDGIGIHPKLSRAELNTAIAGAEADLLLVGHVHFAQDYRLDSIRVANTGGVSNPLPPDLTAKYAILSCDADGYEIESRRVQYDRKKVIERAEAVNHPALEYIARFMNGERKPDWMTETTGV
jgi:predicted phosphodiesterase